jgi:hypothetical protein
VEGSGAAATAIDINNTSTGDPKINFQLSGTTTFSVGIDDTDSKFKIGTSALETGTAITIDASQNVGVGTASPASTLDIQGSMGLKYNTITAATTLNQTHNVVLCNTGPYTVTLPAAASNAGKVYYIKNISSTNVTITLDGNASETIDGSTTYGLGLYKHAVRIICDGSNWHVLENSGSKLTTSTFTTTNCDATGMVITDVLNSSTGKIWMDRNLGASQVASSSTDANSYGELYQWGRLKDGHQCRASSTTATQSSTDIPGNANFITGSTNWRSTTNDNLWQGVSGINNPCPSGYRLPTAAEWAAEAATWSTQNQAGAFASPLKLPLTGERYSTGVLNGVAGYGMHWSSTVSGTDSNVRHFDATSTGNYANNRASGQGVRCIKD